MIREYAGSRGPYWAIAAALIPACRPSLALAVPINYSWSPVGNPGNATDPASGNQYGAVNYTYNIGTYDVTNSEYVAFLNANDPTGADPLGLYNSHMSNVGFTLYGGINAFNGIGYTVMPGDGNHPVNWVTWFDAIRFANWMDNGQPVFTTEPTASTNATENGAYTLQGFAPTPANANSIARNATASIFLPSENEWYKAAYYNRATRSYYLYPTSSTNPPPTASAPTALPNHANFDNAVVNLTNVGAYTGTTSPYGAFDMGGDVYQWNDTLISIDGGLYRGLRGDSFIPDASDMRSTFSIGGTMTDEIGDYGFRLASAPEPSTCLLATLGAASLWFVRRRRGPFLAGRGQND